MLFIKIMNVSVYLCKHVNVRIRLNGYELNCCDVIVRGFLIEFVTITKFLIFSGLFFNLLNRNLTNTIIILQKIVLMLTKNYNKLKISIYIVLCHIVSRDFVVSGFPKFQTHPPASWSQTLQPKTPSTVLATTLMSVDIHTDIQNQSYDPCIHKELLCAHR